MKEREVKELVKSWNFRLSIWDIYEYLKEKPANDQSMILTYCAYYFTDKSLQMYFKDMAYHFDVPLYSSLGKAEYEIEKANGELN